MKDIANIVSENIVTLAEELDFFMSNDAIHQVLRVMPVMLLKREKCIFLNLHELIYTPRVIEALLLSADPNIDSEEHEPETVNDINENMISTETPEKNLNENRGQPYRKISQCCQHSCRFCKTTQFCCSDSSSQKHWK